MSQQLTTNQLRLIADRSPCHVCLMDADLRVFYANEALRDECQYFSGEWFGRDFRELVGEHTYAEFESWLHRAANGETVSFQPAIGDELDAPEWLHARIVPELNDRGEVATICVFATDISDHVRTQEQLGATLRRINLALSGEFSGYWELDRRRPEWMFTGHFEKLLGYPAGKLDRREAALLEIIHPGDVEAYRQNRDSHLSQQTKWAVDFRAQTADGQWRWLQSVGQSSRDGDVTGSLVAGTICDINESRLLHLATEKKLAVRENLLATITHELRDPTNAIAAAIGQLEQRSADTNEALGIITRQAAILSRLINDLKDSRQLGYEHMTIQHESVSVAELVRDVRHTVASILGTKNQTLNVDLEHAESQINSDPVRIIQSLTNVIQNASRFSNRDTTIDFVGRLYGNRYQFVVIDEGRGIDRDDLTRIFERSWQGSPPSATREGEGVGLYLVERIVHALGGNVSAESDGLGQGSTFTICLPLDPPRRSVDDSRESAKEQHQPADPLAAHKIVLVEDNDDARYPLARSLTNRGYDVVAFADGETAVQSIPSLNPDTVIIDIGLPHMNGIELVKLLTSGTGLEGTAFIAMTGYDSPAIRRQALAAGFCCHLVKPVNIEQIEASLHQHSE